MSFRLALLSPIPVLRFEGGLRSVDLWVRDLHGQVDAVAELVLLAPIVDAPSDVWRSQVDVPAAVRVVDPARLCDAELARLLEACDVVQVQGNFTWRQSRPARRLLRAARAQRKPVIVGISSDRARTEVINAAGARPARRLRAWLTSASIRASQRHLVRRSDGVFVVGAGLRRLVDGWNRNVHVGTASWIRTTDIAAPRAEPAPGHRWRLCVAARLERMKGIHLAIDAWPTLAGLVGGTPLQLDVAGVGPEDAALRAQAAGIASQASGPIRFVGALAYPGPFFAFLREVDLVLLTNLNDEQPRLVFDAIGQGCLPVCPDSLPYRNLGLPAELLYRRGDAAALARCVAALIATPDRSALRERLHAIAHGATIETMHRIRHDWIRDAVLAPPR